MKTANKTFTHQTKSGLEFIDITDEIEDFVKESEIRNGLVNVQTLHTTTAIILNENEPLLIEDIKENIKRTALKDHPYKHNDFKVRTVNMCNGECANGHSHCQAIHLTPNIVINLIGGKMQFGQWQRILFVELDRARSRNIQIQIIGE